MTQNLWEKETQLLSVYSLSKLLEAQIKTLFIKKKVKKKKEEKMNELFYLEISLL